MKASLGRRGRDAVSAYDRRLERGFDAESLFEAKAITCQSDPYLLACFPSWKIELRDFHYQQLDRLADEIKQSLKTGTPVVHIRLTGHAAKFGAGDKFDLAKARALMVEQALKARLVAQGVDPMRFTFETLTKGDTQPRADDRTKTGRALNRRVSVDLMRGKRRIKPTGKTSRRVDTITIWLNAFIPNDVPGWTETVDKGPEKGKVGLISPIGEMTGGLVDDVWYLTDQRSFSRNPRISSRMHTLMTFDVRGTPKIIQRTVRIDPTVKVKREDGTVMCRKTGSTKQMHISPPLPFTQKHIEFTFSGVGLNPCTPGGISTAIDYRVDFKIHLNTSRSKAVVEFDARVDEFPSFEAYVVINRDFVMNSFELFTLKASDDPNTLFSPPTKGQVREKKGRVTAQNLSFVTAD
jgi:hypothetical protein